MSPRTLYLATPAARAAVIDPTEGMACPECLARGQGGMARIGSRRGECGTCNRFGAAVRRAAMTILKEKHPRAYSRAMKQARISVYTGLVIAAAERGDHVESPTQVVTAPLPRG